MTIDTKALYDLVLVEEQRRAAATAHRTHHLREDVVGIGAIDHRAGHLRARPHVVPPAAIALGEFPGEVRAVAELRR